jgi:hypothetical protein
MAQAGKGLAVVIALVGLAAGGLLYLHYDRLLQVPERMAMDIAVRSPQVRESLGDPISCGGFPRAKLLGGHGEGNADITMSVSGPRGSGTLAEWAQENKGQWHLCSLEFRLHTGEARVELIRDESTDCERE